MTRFLEDEFIRSLPHTHTHTHTHTERERERERERKSAMTLCVLVNDLSIPALVRVLIRAAV